MNICLLLSLPVWALPCLDTPHPCLLPWTGSLTPVLTFSALCLCLALLPTCLYLQPYLPGLLLPAGWWDGTIFYHHPIPACHHNLYLTPSHLPPPLFHLALWTFYYLIIPIPFPLVVRVVCIKTHALICMCVFGPLPHWDFCLATPACACAFSFIVILLLGLLCNSSLP